MTPSPTYNPWPLETIGDAKKFGALKGFRIEGHGSIASGPQYLVLTFEGFRDSKITEYRVDFTKDSTKASLFMVIKNATSTVLEAFSKYGSGGVSLNLAINEAQETVDTVDSKLNEFK
jgi:hypothetical protein